MTERNPDRDRALAIAAEEYLAEKDKRGSQFSVERAVKLLNVMRDITRRPKVEPWYTRGSAA